MTKKLSEYTVDELAGQVEGGNDSTGQKAMPLLIAKTTLELSHSVDSLRGVVEGYSRSSDKSSNIMKWLTVVLAIATVANVVVFIIK